MKGKFIRTFATLLAGSFFLFPSIITAAPPAQFGAPTNFVFGGSAAGLVPGHFNNDGFLDLVGAVTSSNTVNLIAGNGDGSFAAPVSFNVKFGPGAIAVGDINNDGNLDVIAASDSASSTFCVLLGDGAGSFNMTNYPTRPGFGSSGIALGDFNDDGNIDFATGGSGVLIYSGNGNGTFNFLTNFTSPSLVYDVAVADLNHDNRPEIITANYSSSSMSVFSNLGSGLFSAPTNYPGDFSEYHFSVVTGDFNGDGHTDLATINQYNSSASVRLNTGDGSFGADIKYPLGYWPIELVTADLNGDGILDLVTSPGYIAPISILPGNGNGTFGAPITNFSPVASSKLAVGDFNGDGRPDVATAVTFGNALTISLNETKPSLHLSSVELLGASVQLTNPAPIGYAIGNNPKNVVLKDFNGDGFPDVALGEPFQNRIAVKLNNGTNSFKEATNFVAGTGASFVAAGDLNKDGKIDLVSANSGTVATGTDVSVLLGIGNGAFGAATNFPTASGPVRLVIADFNHDTNLDLVVGGSRVQLLLGEGNGSFGAASNIFLFGSSSLAAGDFNTDSHLDLVTMDANFGLHFVWGNGDGTFETNNTVVLNGGAMVIADFNDDGAPDIAASRFNGVVIMMGDGKGNFATNTIPTPVISGFVLPAAADLNSDNKLDLLIVAQNSTLTALLGKGDGTFSIQTNIIASPGAGFLVTGDLNKDAKPDVVSIVTSGTTMRRFLNLTPPAQLQPSRIGGRFKLRWPAWPGSILEYSTNLSNPGWTAVTNAATIYGEGNVMTNLFENDHRYYRLRFPQ